VLLPHTRRRSHDYRIAGAFFAGTTSGALVSAVTLWGLSGFFSYLGPGARVVTLSIGAALVWVPKQMPGALPFSLPENKRQIPAHIFGQPPTRAAMKFGFELGTGVRTYVPVPAPYLLPLFLLVGWMPLAVAVSLAIGFGLGRALPLLTPLSVARNGPVGAAFLSGAAPDARIAFLTVLIGGLYLV
jgi:hypothetical protein